MYNFKPSKSEIKKIAREEAVPFIYPQKPVVQPPKAMSWDDTMNAHAESAEYLRSIGRTVPE